MDRVELTFGITAVVGGMVGVPLGLALSTYTKCRFPRADPVICGAGIFFSSIFLSTGMALTRTNLYLCFTCLWFGQVGINLSWSIVVDITMSLVTPTNRGTATALQTLVGHALGDAGSPYLIGLISDQLLTLMTGGVLPCEERQVSGTCIEKPVYLDYRYLSLLYSLLTNCGVQLIGGTLFFITAIYIVEDKRRAGQFCTRD